MSYTYLEEWLPEELPNVDFSTVTPEKWDEINEMVTNDVRCGMEVDSDRVQTSYIREAESDERVRIAEDNLYQEIAWRDERIRELESYVYRLECRLQDARRD